jgi:hypothetical protein
MEESVKLKKQYLSPSIVISILALVISMFGYLNSREALRHSKSAFMVENRPYLILDIVPFQENNSYFLTEKQPDGKILLIMRFKMENAGKIPAQDISASKTSSFEIESASDIKKEPLSLNGPVVTLGPNQTEFFRVDTILQSKSNQPDKIIEEIMSEAFKMKIHAVFSYTSLLNNRTIYKTASNFLVSKTKVARFGKNEMF